MKKEFMLGAWVGGTGLYPQPTEDNIQSFQALQGGHIDLVSLFAQFDVNCWDWVEQFAETARKNGSTLVVTWMPTGYSAHKIIEGEADAVLAASVFHYGELTIRQVKEYMRSQGIPVRL